MIRRLIRFLVRKKILKAPKQHMFVVEGRVYLDGKLIKQFPIEVWAVGRRAAKFGLERRLSFGTGTVAKKVDLIKHG